MVGWMDGWTGSGNGNRLALCEDDCRDEMERALSCKKRSVISMFLPHCFGDFGQACKVVLFS